MDWSKIKTIFIIAFLVLDIYLIYEYSRLKEEKPEITAEIPLENRLANYGVTYPNLPTEISKDQYLSAKSKTFSEEEKTKLEKGLLKGQDIRIIDSIMLQSIIEKPISISDPFKKEDLADFIQNHVLNGDEYRFWEKKDNTITYYQQHDGKTLFQNLKGELTFLVNEENKVVSYNQTYLENVKEIDDEESLVPPIEAIYALFTNSDIPNDSEIKSVELGYYSQQYTSVQVLSPTWKVTLEDNQNLYVNALDRQIIKPGTDETKLE